MLRVNGELVTVNPTAFYGGVSQGGVFEYLYRFPDGRWFLHTVNVVQMIEPSFAEVPEDFAVGWLIRSRRIEEDEGQSGPNPAKA